MLAQSTHIPIHIHTTYCLYATYNTYPPEEKADWKVDEHATVAEASSPTHLPGQPTSHARPEELDGRRGRWEEPSHAVQPEKTSLLAFNLSLACPTHSSRIVQYVRLALIGIVWGQIIVAVSYVRYILYYVHTVASPLKDFPTPLHCHEKWRGLGNAMARGNGRVKELQRLQWPRRLLCPCTVTHTYYT